MLVFICLRLGYARNETLIIAEIIQRRGTFAWVAAGHRETAPRAEAAENSWLIPGLARPLAALWPLHTPRHQKGGDPAQAAPRLSGDLA